MVKNEAPIAWKNSTPKIHEILEFLFEYFKNPIQGIRQLPQWDWRTILMVQGSLSAVTGLLSGIVAQSISRIFLGFIFFPISSVICHFVVSGFFYYTFLFFYKTQVQFRQLYLVTILANLPFVMMIVLSPLFRPIALLGLGVTAMLSLVGFVENFLLPRRSLTRLLLGIYVAYVIMWITSSLNLTKKETAFRKMATPESLDILERELKGK